MTLNGPGILIEAPPRRAHRCARCADLGLVPATQTADNEYVTELCSCEMGQALRLDLESSDAAIKEPSSSLSA